MELGLNVNEKEYAAILEGKQTFLYGHTDILDDRYDVGTMVTLYPHDSEGNRIPGKFNVVVTYRMDDEEAVILSIIWITPPDLQAFITAKHEQKIKNAPLQSRQRSQTVRGISIE